MKELANAGVYCWKEYFELENPPITDFCYRKKLSAWIPIATPIVKRALNVSSNQWLLPPVEALSIKEPANRWLLSSEEVWTIEEPAIC